MNTCRIPLVSTRDACGKPATHVVVFLDGDRAPACHGCALALEQTALSHRASVKVEKIDG